MPMNKARERAMTWLRSMCANENSFDAINAGNVLAIIDKQEASIRSLAIHIRNLRRQRDRAYEVINDAREQLENTKSGAH